MIGYIGLLECRENKIFEQRENMGDARIENKKELLAFINFF